MLLATSGPNLSPKVVTSREEVSTSWSSPVASTWEEDSQQSPAVASCPPCPPTARPLPAWQPQPTDLTARKCKLQPGKSKNQPGGRRYKPVLAAREHPRSRKPAVHVAARSSALPAWQPQPTDLTAMDANFSRESRRISREDTCTSWSSPLARLRAVAWQLSPPCPAPTSRPLTFH